MTDFALVLPTRERPGPFLKALASCLESCSADILVYIDDNDPKRGEYYVSDDPRVKTYFGPARGKINAVNALVAKHKEYRYYMPVTDDMNFVRSDWEDEFRRIAAGFSGDIGVVSLAHDPNEKYANWEIVSRSWIDTLGWLYHPSITTYCPDTIIQILAEGLGRLVTITPQVVVHNIINIPELAGRFDADCKNFLWYCAKSYGEDIAKLRRAAQ